MQEFPRGSEKRVGEAARNRKKISRNLGALQFVTRSRLSTALLAVATLAGPATAETYQLICENPRREYQVRFSDGDANTQLDVPAGTTLYRVLAVEETEARHVVVALTMNDGPTVRLSLRPYLRMEYWSGNELFQTDACRNQ
jgi:hypothetical protein